MKIVTIPVQDILCMMKLITSCLFLSLGDIFDNIPLFRTPGRLLQSNVASEISESSPLDLLPSVVAITEHITYI